MAALWIAHTQLIIFYLFRGAHNCSATVCSSQITRDLTDIQKIFCFDSFFSFQIDRIIFHLNSVEVSSHPVRATQVSPKLKLICMEIILDNIFKVELLELQHCHHSSPPHAKGFFLINNETCLKVSKLV